MAHRDTSDGEFDRRALLRVAAVGVSAGGFLAVAPSFAGDAAADSVPNNFRAAIHVTRQEDFTYAFSALDTIAQHYKKATGHLIIDGDAVKSLTDDAVLTQLQNAKDSGAEIVAASDALSINGIDPSSLPDYIKSGDPGVIAVVDAQVKGFHYYKI